MPHRRLFCTTASALLLAALGPATSAQGEATHGAAHRHDFSLCPPAVVQLPLPPGVATGGVQGGRGERILLGGEAQDFRVGHPMLWRRDGCDRWSVTDLSPSGRVQGFAVDIDRHRNILINSGWVRTRDGEFHRLKTFADFTASGMIARHINSHGVIVGAVFDSEGLRHGAVWPSWRSRPRHLAPLAFPEAADSVGRDINDHGDIPGASCSPGCADSRGGVWPGARTRGFVIKGLEDSHIAEPTVINNHGTLAGGACNSDCSAIGATVWYDLRKPRLVGVLPGDDDATFLGISGNGQAVGYSFTSDLSRDRVAYWPGYGPLRTLPTLMGYPNTVAHHVTNGHLVGGSSYATDFALQQPTVWVNANVQSFVPSGDLE